MIRDGRNTGENADEPVRDLEVGELDPRQPQQLELCVEEPDASPGTFQVTAFWNGQQVHVRQLTGLRTNTRTELFVDLVVRGRSTSSDLSVAFDDFTLVRRTR